MANCYICVIFAIAHRTVMLLIRPDMGRQVMSEAMVASAAISAI